MSEYINNIIYGLKSFVTGMKLTMHHFRNKKELVSTLQYPNEKWPIPDRNIGFENEEYNLIRSRLHVDIDDCIGCLQCERACPVDCIKIDSIKPPKGSDIDCGMTSNDTQKKMIVSRFTIDMSECMYCNLCVYPCPEECIYMVGGPNEGKHEIDYEFSQYKRDGMIFEFADATDKQILDAGGDKWIEDRDAKLLKFEEGAELKGGTPLVPESVEKVEQPSGDKDKVVAAPVIEKRAVQTSIDIKSFNVITDKMIRGISKKVFTSSKRAGKDATAILADVAQALSDAGKMTVDIQAILDELSSLTAAASAAGPSDSTAPLASEPVSDSSTQAADPVVSKEMDIKDLNALSDKMARGTAKKAFTAAKRTGEDKVEAVRKALKEADLLNDESKALLDSLVAPDNSQAAAPLASEPVSDSSIQAAEPVVSKEMDIKDLNALSDKMARGTAKKAFTAAKRNGEDKVEAVRRALKEADLFNDDIENILKEFS